MEHDLVNFISGSTSRSALLALNKLIIKRLSELSRLEADKFNVGDVVSFDIKGKKKKKLNGTWTGEVVSRHGRALKIKCYRNMQITNWTVDAQLLTMVKQALRDQVAL